MYSEYMYLHNYRNELLQKETSRKVPSQIAIPLKGTFKGIPAVIISPLMQKRTTFKEPS